MTTPTQLESLLGKIESVHSTLCADLLDLFCQAAEAGCPYSDDDKRRSYTAQFNQAMEPIAKQYPTAFSLWNEIQRFNRAESMTAAAAAAQSRPSIPF